MAKIVKHSTLKPSLNYSADKIKEDVADIIGYGNINATQLDITLDDIYNSMKERLDNSQYHYKEPIRHISINPDMSDWNNGLTDYDLNDICEGYIQKMGWQNCPYVIFKHEDIKRPHAHIVLVAIDENGKIIRQKECSEFHKSERVSREIEKEFGLKPATKGEQIEIASDRPNRIDKDTPQKIAHIRNNIELGFKKFRFTNMGKFKKFMECGNITFKIIDGETENSPKKLQFMILDEKGNPNSHAIYGSELNIGNKKYTLSSLENRCAYNLKIQQQRLSPNFQNIPYCEGVPPIEETPQVDFQEKTELFTTIGHIQQDSTLDKENLPEWMKKKKKRKLRL